MNGCGGEIPARIFGELASALRRAGAPPGFEPDLERPRDSSQGDWASNAALVLARQLGEPPRSLAGRVRDLIDVAAAGVGSVEVAGPGFLNFRLSDESIWRAVAGILEDGPRWGRSIADPRRRINVEFVSANPTGPLHVAHGRGAALGDAVASLLAWAGHEVTRDFYVNDAGRQIELLADSVDARYEELAGRPGTVPEGGYHGDYVRDLAAQIRDAAGAAVMEELSPEERRARFRREAVRILQEAQEDDLRAFGVEMDRFYSERSLYETGAVDRLLERLAERSLTYDKGGAKWLRTTEFGDEKDRVLVKSDGSYTYFLPDLAYHLDKARRGFDIAIDVWGADHHGHEQRMQAALEGLGLPKLLEVLLMQLVTITRAGKEARMSKRAGRFVTLRELVGETGADVARYFFLMRRADVHLNFDLDLALDTSEANPVYKVQYGHARMCSVFRRAGIDPEDIVARPEDTAARPEDIVARPEDTATRLDGMKALATAAEREVALAILQLPEVIAGAAASREPHSVCAYLEKTAGLVNAWYHQGNLDPEKRILAEGPNREGRIKLARAVQITLRNGLAALGLSAPQTLSRDPA